MSERTYAAFDPRTEEYLRSDWDDVTRNAMFDIRDDVSDKAWILDGARWTPRYGWVSPHENLEHIEPYR